MNHSSEHRSMPLWHRAVSFCLALLMLLSLLPGGAVRVSAASKGDTFYLKPNSNWLEANARFAAYFFVGDSNTWVSMIASDRTGYYECVVPEDGFTSVIFVRMNPSTTSNNWDNAWDQTNDLNLSEGNCYTVSEGAWSRGDGSWSTYTTYSLVGTMNAWDAAKGKMTSSDGNIFTCTVTLKAGTYTFKINGTDGSWYGNDGTIDNTTTATSETGWVMATTAGDCTLNATGGTYTFTFNAQTKALIVTFVADQSSCSHSYSGTVTKQPTCTATGTRTHTCNYCGHSYTETIATIDHSYSGGKCTVCGATDPNYNPDYYLIGNINGADYGCNADSANLGKYKFVNGKLVTTFTSDSYVFIKTGDNLNWYMTEGYDDSLTSVTLYNTSSGLTDANKLFVPGGIEVTFTLVKNSNGTLTLSYTTAATRTIYFDATLSKLSYSGDTNSVTKYGIPGKEGVLHYYATGDGVADKIGMLTPVEDTQYPNLYSVELDIRYDQITFANYQLRTLQNYSWYGESTSAQTIPEDLSAPCFYADSSDDVVYYSFAGNVRDGYWGEARNIRSAEFMKNKDVVDIPSGTLVQDSETLYVPSTFYDYYTDFELNGYNRDSFETLNNAEGTFATYQNWYPFRHFDQALSDYYEDAGALVPIYVGHFQPDWKDEYGNPWGYQFKDIADTLNLYGFMDGKAYGSEGNMDQKWFMSVNNSVLDLDWTTDNIYSAAQGIVSDELSDGTVIAAGSIIAAGTNVELPFFNEAFLEGSNSKNTKLGEVFENVAFPFTQQDTHNDGIEYWVFDSSKTTLTMMDNSDEASSYKYYLEEVTDAATREKYRNLDSGSNPQSEYGFFPFNSGSKVNTVDGKAVPDAGTYNYGFGTSMSLTFNLTESGTVTDKYGNEKPIVFEFSGDDDLWIFLDGELVLDIGGSHGKVDGSINFQTMRATVSSVKSSGGSNTSGTDVEKEFTLNGKNTDNHTLTLFYMERGMWESNMHITFNFFPAEELLPETTSMTVTKNWDLTEDTETPESVKVQLQYSRDGNTWINSGDPVVLTENENWSHSFAELQKYYTVTDNTTNETVKVSYAYRVVELGDNNAVLANGNFYNGLFVSYGPVYGNSGTGYGQLITNSSPSMGMTVDKRVDEGDSANQFVLTLDAYAKGNLVNVTKPADIVLVLDHSGSMRTPVGAPSVLHSPSGDYAGEVYTGAGSLTKDQLDTDKGQHIGYYVAQSTSTKWWFVMEYDADTALWIGYSVPSTEAIVNPDQPVGSAATEHTKEQSWSYADIPAQFVFYKTQYGMLYDEVTAFVKALKNSGIEHRVSIVAFAGSETQGTGVYLYTDRVTNATGFKNYRSLHLDTTSDARRTELYQAAMKSVQDTTQYQELMNSIDAINTNFSFTCPAAGFDLANEILAANEVNLAARDRVVVLFTDGIPNVKIGEEMGDTTTDQTVRNTAIWNEIVGKAAVAKQEHGAKVYCISTTTMGTSAHDRTFLAYSSSEYPDAISYDTPNSMVEDGVQYSFHGSSDALNVAFQQIQQESANSFVKLDKSTVLREVLSDYVMLDDAATVQYKVYTQDYLGGGRWGDLDEFTEAEGMKHTLTSSDGSARMDTIEISGFDYNECYISETARAKTQGAEENYYGTKIVLKVWIESRTGFWGGNNVPTNKNSTAIYLDGKVVEPFPMPEVNIPIDVEITTKDKTIYYGNDVTGGDLIDKITVNGSEVEIDGDTLKPTEEWMDDFSEIKWTEDSTKSSTDLSGTDPKDYTFGVQVTPTKDGENNSQATNPGNIAGDPVPTEGDTDDSTGHVYIKVPTVTFQDSTINFGATPDDAHYSANDVVKNEDETVKVEWTFLEDTDTADAPDVTGDEPTLSLTYRPIGDGSFAFDTPVDVTVSSSNGADISDVTTFDWEDCEHKLHDEGVIPSHTANAENQAEFYVHVEIQIQPDTVVIDYGLPVDIDVLANDPVYENVDRVFAGIAAKDTSVFAGENVPGVYGVLSVNGDGTVRYTLNTSNGMQMEKEDVFAYGVTYTKNGTERTLPSTVTIIPATTIYYEDGFLTYSVIDDDTGEAVENYGWTEVKDKNYDPDAVQAEDRPGPDVTALDADNIYGYDGAYTAMTEYSLGSAAMVNVGYKYNNDGSAVMVPHDDKQEPLRTTAIAEFTFSGTGFDVVSLTSAKTGTILVEVQGVTDASFNELYIVDTYYGYKQVNGEWVVDPDASDALYQVPVMKVDGLTYGKYNVKIIASWAELFDHEQYGDKQNYDFYLDAIRIYDPANDGAGNTVIEDAYVDDGEGWPEYFELRDLLIKANDFNSLDGESKATGIVFIDNTADTTGKTSYSVADYQNYGPNNELYLAKDQAVTFTLNVGEVVNGESNVAGIHIAMKSTGGTANAVIKKTSGGASSAEQVLEQEIKTATDLYYDITAVNGYTVVIKNTGDDILSITNIKVTYKSAHEDSIENDYFRVTKSGVQDALNLLAEDDLRVNSGALTPESATLSLEDEVHYNIYFSSTLTGVSAENMGLLVWDSKPASPSYANADEIYAGVTADGNRFKVTTDGIPAKEMGDTKYFMLYAKNTDGSYTYSEMFEYSVRKYCENRLSESRDVKLKSLCVALLNYGAAAQTYFGYRTGDLMNAGLTATQKDYVQSYSADLLDDVGTVAEEKIGEYAATAGAYIAKQATVTLGGALELNFYFTPSKTTDAITLYYWNEVAYASEEALSSITPTGTIKMENNGGKFRGTVTGIAAKNMDDTIYVCGVYEVNGVKYSTGIIPYSIASYCEKKAATGDEAIVPLAEATAVYGYYAKTYFAP